ncbi:MAG: hypothetical protein ACI93R_003271 [Flavobacteriales bacterium]|jgi:hypothetical protein
MSWLYSRALVVAYSAESYSIGEPCAPLSVTPTQHKFWRNDKMMEFSKLSRFGLTCAVLTEDHGVELLTSFLAAFPARTLALQAKEKELPANDRDFGLKWHASFAKYDPDTHSLKTAQCSLLEDSNKSYVTLPRWGSMQNGVCSEHTTVVPNTSAIEFGFLRTVKKRPQGLIPTPTKSTADKEVISSQNGRNLVAYAKLYPTPMACDHKGAPSPKRTQQRRENSTRGVPLPEHIQREQSEPVSGQLNPTWVEWLMGWTLEWTDLKPLATDKFQEWLQQHSRCCKPELNQVKLITDEKMKNEETQAEYKGL